MFRSLLALHDLSESSRRALQWALRFGEQFRSRLTVLSVIPPVGPPPGVSGTGPAENQLTELTRLIRTEIDKDLRACSVGAPEGRLGGLEVVIATGRPLAIILKRILDGSPDLVFVGTHGRKGLSRAFLGSVAEKVVRHSPSPVFVARKAPQWPPQAVLIPADVAEPPDEALALATRLRETLPFRVDLLSVLSSPDLMEAFPEAFAGYSPVDERVLKRKALDALKALAARYPALGLTPHLASGPVAAEIGHAAEEFQSDFILMPTHGRAGVGRFFLGSVAEQVVRYAPCSVLSVCPSKAAPYRKKVATEWMEAEP
ncbi:MAG TPA: universal stress protein [bacterium]|nr:universal stress protein [bacterium]